MNVSRETPAVPESAQRVFSARYDEAVRYAELLATEGTLRGLIGPREVPRLWERHLLNSAALSSQIPASATVCDVGSGAGLPGLVLALARPDLTVTLLEPLLRRTTFLEEVVGELGLTNVDVVRGRADSLHGRRTFDVVTSRAVAPLDRLLEWSMPLVAPSGALVAMKGSSVAEEVQAHASVWQRLGCTVPQVLELVIEGADDHTFAVRVAWARPGQVSSDRSVGSMSDAPSRVRTTKRQSRKK
ncbi:Ribosomal RNA small subunit methyltransferase G [metagenome]|uniref:Ribosomal RNA small subunit methyltransferase G n=1 Tax=metagenome TaxID=256318 RepID=A0A2P2BZ70_9ZZZZ